MSALTRTDLVNLSLREIGTDRIEDHTEASPEADVARDQWDQAVRMTLSRHEWHFAMTSAALPRSVSTPTVRYNYTYTLPADFVRFGSVSDNRLMEPILLDFAHREDGIHTDSTAVFIEYVYDAPAIGVWPPWFVSVFVADLASLMASPLKSTTERERIEGLAEARLRTARTLDSQQGAPKRWPEGTWSMAHRGMRQR
jgi:hypothetical protein